MKLKRGIVNTVDCIIIENIVERGRDPPFEVLPSLKTDYQTSSERLRIYHGLCLPVTMFLQSLTNLLSK